ncbi:MAG: MBL fold metallo-hydrolase [Bryobacteraceae bacterium]
MGALWILLALAVQQAAAPPPPRAAKLADGVYWVKGGAGANTGFITGKKQVLVIDAKTTPDAARAMLGEIAAVTPNPVTRVVLTHSDGDHVNGLAALPREATVIAHANARKDMEEAFQDAKLAALKPWVPRETVEDSRTLKVDGLEVRLLHFGPAHTNGDLVVYIPARKIAFIGDLAFVGRDPLIHRHKNGNSFGVVRTLNRLASLDADTFISGHSDPLTKQDLRALAAAFEEKQAKVKELVSQGKSLEEIKTAFGVAGGGAARRPGLIEVIYLEITGKK